MDSKFIYCKFSHSLLGESTSNFVTGSSLSSSSCFNISRNVTPFNSFDKNLSFKVFILAVLAFVILTELSSFAITFISISFALSSNLSIVSSESIECLEASFIFSINSFWSTLLDLPVKLFIFIFLPSSILLTTFATIDFLLSLFISKSSIASHLDNLFILISILGISFNPILEKLILKYPSLPKNKKSMSFHLINLVLSVLISLKTIDIIFISFSYLCSMFLSRTGINTIFLE